MGRRGRGEFEYNGIVKLDLNHLDSILEFDDL